MKTALYIGFLILTIGVTHAAESKVICGKKYSTNGTNEPAYTDPEDRAITSINEKIKTAESEGFTKVSAPVGIGYDGAARAFCVTVTKP